MTRRTNEASFLGPAASGTLIHLPHPDPTNYRPCDNLGDVVRFVLIVPPRSPFARRGVLTAQYQEGKSRSHEVSEAETGALPALARRRVRGRGRRGGALHDAGAEPAESPHLAGRVHLLALRAAGAAR